MSKKVLIFTYYWPPAGGVAVQRWLKFAKYLPEFGWEPIIVTVENGSYPYYDESLLKEISPALRVYRTKTFEPFELYNLLRGAKGKAVPTQSITDAPNKTLFQKASEYVRANFFIPDARKGWVKYAVKQAEEILKKENIDAIVTSGPPHSTHLIGLELKRKHDIKWLADFRDPWTEIFYNKFLPRTEATKRKDYALETNVLQSSDAVLTISNGIKNMLQTRSKRMEVLLNGFDNSDLHYSTEPVKNDKFILGHIGSYVAALNSEGLWQALQQLMAEEENFKHNFILDFTGRVDESILAKMKSYGLTDIIRFNPFTKHAEAVERMYRANLLLLVLANVPDNRYIISGKLFEYLASSTPILGIAAKDGDANVILKEAGRDGIIDYDDTAAIKALILKYYRQWKESDKTSLKVTTANLLKYQRKEITKRLAELLDEVAHAAN